MTARHFYICSCLLLLIFHAEARTKEISICSQESFDALSEQLYANLKVGYEDIIIRFDAGTYYYEDRHLNLDRLLYPQTRIHFIGQGATLTAAGEDLRNGDRLTIPIDSGTGVVCDAGDVFLWSDVHFADSKVQVIDSESRLCRVRCKAIRKEKIGDLSSCYILLTEWYLSKMMKVSKVEDGAIYFTADKDLDFLNADVSYGKMFPRFKLLNTIDAPFYTLDDTVHLSPQIDVVHICRTGRLLSAYDSSFKSIRFDGFRFIGNRDNIFALMDFTNTHTEDISITDCEFCGLRSKLIQVAYSPCFSFTNNNVHDCYRGGIKSIHSAKTRVSGNVFHNVGLALSNDFSVECGGEDYLISYNTISDFGYGGISVGLHFTTPRTGKITGTVKNNELWYSERYFADYPSHTLMDSGAIYTSTQHDRCVIRDNYIHDYIGMKDNRGIFMDDGASNVIVVYNTILRIPNSWSIDSRLVKEVETMPGSQVSRANVGNLILGNRVDGMIRFEKP